MPKRLVITLALRTPDVHSAEQLMPLARRISAALQPVLDTAGWQALVDTKLTAIGSASAQKAFDARWVEEWVDPGGAAVCPPIPQWGR